MVEVRFVDLQEDFFAGRIDAERTGFGQGEFAESQNAIVVRRRGAAAGAGVGEKDPAVFGEARVQGEALKTSFIEGTLVPVQSSTESGASRPEASMSRTWPI